MTRLSMRGYRPEDFLTMGIMESEAKNREGQPVQMWAELHASAGPAVTFIDPAGEVVFCCGVTDFWPGVGEMWACFSPLAKKYPDTLRAAKWALEHIIFETCGYWRVQAILAVDNEAAIRFDERLGFKREGIMRKYGPHGEDRILYSLLREDFNGK